MTLCSQHTKSRKLDQFTPNDEPHLQSRPIYRSKLTIQNPCSKLTIEIISWQSETHIQSKSLKKIEQATKKIHVMEMEMKSWIQESVEVPWSVVVSRCPGRWWWAGVRICGGCPGRWWWAAALVVGGRCKEIFNGRGSEKGGGGRGWFRRHTHDTSRSAISVSRTGFISSRWLKRRITEAGVEVTEAEAVVKTEGKVGEADHGHRKREREGRSTAAWGVIHGGERGKRWGAFLCKWGCWGEADGVGIY